MKKEIWLPNWMMKRIPMGKEQDEFSGIAVPSFLIVLIGIATVWYNFFQGDWLLWVMGTIMVLILSFIVYYQFAIQIASLEKIREKLNSDYFTAADLKEKEEIKKKLEELCVYV